MLVRVLVKWGRIGWVVGITMWCPCSFSTSSSAPTKTLKDRRQMGKRVVLNIVVPPSDAL